MEGCALVGYYVLQPTLTELLAMFRSASLHQKKRKAACRIVNWWSGGSRVNLISRCNYCEIVKNDIRHTVINTVTVFVVCLSRFDIRIVAVDFNRI